VAPEYCVDTSSLIAAWQELYPIENFPSFWTKFDALIQNERVISPVEVFREIGKRSDELQKWLKPRNSMFRELEQEIQIEAAQVLTKFPRLVGERKLRTSADPFVIGLARVEGLKLVTDEKATGSASRPNIPDVCIHFGVTTMSVLDLIKIEKWVIG